MTQQREVINAFLEGENAPRQASHFHMEVADDGYTAYLVGDHRVVFAKREPMRQFDLYVGSIPLGYDMPVTRRNVFEHIGRNYLNSQRRRVLRRARGFRRNNDHPDGTEITMYDDSPPPTVDSVEENFGIFAEVEDEP